MSKRPVLLFLLFLLGGCASSSPKSGSDGPPPIQLDGLYRGRYWITEQDGTSEQTRRDGPASMRFDGKDYAVEGDYPYLPPAGGGTFKIDGRTIILTDEITHPANFDWTLILSGRFDVDMGDDGSVRLTQRDLQHARYHELELKPEAQ